ncbi:hypothetical protein GGI12_004564 [Dipsacomyces acuminosporus]|nr:hypothetical protein GGI12_004564 [Dipsacomyces acuminosporus]
MSAYPRTPRYKEKKALGVNGSTRASSQSNGYGRAEQQQQHGRQTPELSFGKQAHNRDAFDSDSSDLLDSNDSDDPTNTAMFLDEDDENELRGIAPGTPLAYKKLGQLTVKSITRQRKAQTPAKQGYGMGTGQTSEYSARETSRYARMESPSKKGKERTAAATSLTAALAAATPGNARSISTPNPAAEENVPRSVRAIRSSRRAASILSAIKSTSPPNRTDRTPSNIPAPKFSSAGSYHTTLDPEFEKNEFSPIVFSRMSRWKESVISARLQRSQQPAAKPAEDDGYQTPTMKPYQLGSSTPYNILKALSEKSNESHVVDPIRNSTSPSKHNDSNANGHTDADYSPDLLDMLNGSDTPKQQRTTKTLIPETPQTEHRQRIDHLRKFFSDQKSVLPTRAQNGGGRAPAGDKGDDGLLISFDTADQSKSGISNPLTSQFSQASTIRKPYDQVDLLHSPTPMRTANVQINGFGGSPFDGDDDDGDAGFVSPLALSNTGKKRYRDSQKPIPFILNQHTDQEEPANDSRSNLIDLSSKLNSSIHALNVGLRDHLKQARKSIAAPENIGETAEAIQQAGKRLNQSLAEIIPKTTLIDGSFAPDQGYTDGLEGQVKTLREAMEDTKKIMYDIQQELGQQRQGHSAEDAKLDDIVRLLGALDMRLHLLEGRQKLEMAPQRTNAGSTKIRPGEQPRDIISRIGQAIVYCLGRYPLMIIGALFIVLVTELFVISGYGLDIQAMRGLGRHAFEGVKKHIVMPPQQPS